MEKETKLLIIFGFFLILFAIFSTKISFHDSAEYITIAKNLAGINNLNVYIGHSALYPLIISLFLRIWPSLAMIKLVNIFWLFLIGLVLLKWLKNKTAFILFIFSPLTWYVSIQITPILPASFLFLLAYIFFKKEEIKYNKLYSGLFLGLSFAFYDTMLFFAFFFILFYFWDKKFSDFVKYIIAFIIGSLPRLCLDFFLFGNPIYTLFRLNGGLAIIVMGLNPTANAVPLLNITLILSVIFLISPFLFKLYKINFKENKKEILFLIFTTLFLFLAKSSINYFLIITPVILLFLSKTMGKKEVKWHCIASIILIFIITFNFLGTTDDVIIQKDIEKIVKDFDVKYIVTRLPEANNFATFLWQDSPKIVWFADFNASLNNETILKEYSFEINKNQKVNTREISEISVDFKRINNQTYEDYIIASDKADAMEKIFKLDKCYEKLCVYE